MPTKTTTPLPLFQRPVWVCLFALTAAVLWGWAYPIIKIGFEEWGITPDMTGSKMLFAGIRFAISGLIILAMARGMHRSFRPARGWDWGFILLFALINTTFHYACFYIGLSHSEGSRAAILNSLSIFLVVVLACVFFKSDRMTLRKMVGVVLGMAGILILNLNGDAVSAEWSWLGDGMIIVNAICSAVASLLTRSMARRVDIIVGTGYSLGIGGLLLIVPGLLMGGTLPHVTLWGLALLGMLVGISTIGFALYNQLITHNPIGKVAIYNSLLPIVGAVTSCLCLGEPFQANYILAGGLVASGIYIVNAAKGNAHR
ncbi:MAG: DMT family transporter [Alloprevotella sp.]|nr:DMT family transporter [Alloprevotella sp.]